MPFDPQVLLSRPPLVTRQIYNTRDTILYALGVGAGIENATDPSELRFLYERALIALPTLAIVIAAPPFWLDDPSLGIDWKRVLNAGQDLILEGPLPVAGSVSTELRIDAIWDKGKDKGAIMDSSRVLRDSSGTKLATIRQTHFLRGNGGFGGPDQPKTGEQSAPIQRAPDRVVDLPTRPEQALLYRLSGDYNPLHIDPDVARTAGFHKPILHGSCTFGIVARALLRTIGNEPGRLRRFGARFSSPVYPGDTIRTEMWQSGSEIFFRAHAAERGITVLDRGIAVIEPPP
jgi:acyl dehydratase